MKTCLVLEGGALRGIYTAGVLDELIKTDIKVDAIIGVSMGSLMAINYISNQPGRGLRYNKKYCRQKNYISFTSFLKTGNIANKDFCYYVIPNELDPFDYETFDHSKTKLYCTVTNVETGKPEYIEITNSKEQIEVLRAGSSMPGVSKIVEIDGKKYLDGGIGDSIPVHKAIEMGFDRIIVVQTRPKGYQKNEKKKSFSFLYKKYPEFQRTLEERNKNYNQTLKDISLLEANKKIFVIQPSKKIPIKRIEHNSYMIQDQYDLGREDFKQLESSLREYLKRK